MAPAPERRAMGLRRLFERRELAVRLLVAELIALPGEGPLAPRFGRFARPGAPGQAPPKSLVAADPGAREPE